MTFSIDNYSLGLCDDHYIIGHFNNLSLEDQEAVLTFLRYMESLKNALPSDDNVSDELIDYADDVVNALTHRMTSTEKTNVHGQLEKIKEFNRMFTKTSNYLKIFSERIKQTTIEAIKTERDKDTFVEADYKGYLDILKEQYVRTEKEAIMAKTYSVAVTDGGYGPVDIKINLTFEEALKECLSHLEPKDIKQFCNLYAISTKDHKAALAHIQEVIEGHLKRDSDFYYDYDNNGNDNTIINIDLRPKLDKYNDARIEIGGYDFFAFAKPEDNYQRCTVAIPGSTENLFVETDPTNKNMPVVVQKGEAYNSAQPIFETAVTPYADPTDGNYLKVALLNPENDGFCDDALSLNQSESETD